MAQQNATAPATSQTTGTAARTGAATARPLVERRVTLSEIGFGQGLEFDRLTGQRVLFFPVGPAEAMASGTLHLSLRHGETLRTARALTVRANDRVLDAIDIDGAGSEEVDIPLPADLLRGPFLKVELSYSGANSEEVCIDERASGDFLRVLPGSGLHLGIDPDGLRAPLAVDRLMPGPLALLLPGEKLTAPALALALRAAARHDAEAGRVTLRSSLPPRADPLWDSGVLSYGGTGEGAGEAPGLRVKPFRGVPGLRVNGPDPQAALALLDSPWQGLARQPGVGRTDIPAAPASGDAISFARLGAPELSARVTGSTTLDFSFPIEALPAGRRPVGLDLLVGATPSPSDGGVSVTAWLNGNFLGARPLRGGDPVWMRFDVPEGLIGRSNELRVLVQRPTEGGDCRFAPQGYPVQILPQSRFTLGDAPEAEEDFHDLRQAAAGRGVSVVLDGVDRATLQDWVLPVAGALLPDDAQVTVEDSLDSAPEDGNDTENAAPARPFLYVSREAPPGSDPVLRFDRGRVEIADRTGNPIFSGDALDRLGSAQIVTIGTRRGVWLRPGDGDAPRLSADAPLTLDRGDLALIDAQGVAVAVSTLRETLVDVRYPDRVNLWQVLARYRLWIVAAGWVLLTLVVVRALQGFYRRSRGKES